MPKGPGKLEKKRQYVGGPGPFCFPKTVVFISFHWGKTRRVQTGSSTVRQRVSWKSRVWLCNCGKGEVLAAFV